MPLIVDAMELAEVMRGLATKRPVFHSEADFQFAFAQQIVSARPSTQVRLEARQPGDRAEYVDLLCADGERRTYVEFKYVTSGWSGQDPASGEQFHLRNHSAFDLARKYFVHDVTRLERFVQARENATGMAVFLTNEPGMWSPPRRSSTRDREFRLHEGRELSGRLVWGSGDHPASDRTLLGTYTARWNDYSALGGRNGELRWLGLEVRR